MGYRMEEGPTSEHRGNSALWGGEHDRLRPSILHGGAGKWSALSLNGSKGEEHVQCKP